MTTQVTSTLTWRTLVRWGMGILLLGPLQLVWLYNGFSIWIAVATLPLGAVLVWPQIVGWLIRHLIPEDYGFVAVVGIAIFLIGVGATVVMLAIPINIWLKLITILSFVVAFGGALLYREAWRIP